MEKPLYNNICEDSLFEKIYNKHSQNLHDFLYYKYGENYNPADKAQEAFVKLWENCSKVTMEKAKSYLFTVANNMMLNEFKHQKVVLNHRKVAPRAYTNENPEYLMQKEEYYQQYQECLAKMSEEQRTAFLLNKVEGKKHAEIAEMLGITRKVVEYRIYSAFDLLKKDLENFKVK
ncbi:hypothetical protein HME9304_00496 [Flagellimonas maritima]|uniref:Sigma-70 family RNA polymerase sigma factor n=1 Tax=Flagellimonas maritima TaxID=1383885 RepID=A0A2Z4LQI0_9FLAO|nr:sigma-70 family RNA polymerase sigma factor [Allomuricauda aurantiaca]AWX43507.1 hypothetical protein HME9304_00496 [Allomuricauda aurantiaca]